MDQTRRMALVAGTLGTLGCLGPLQSLALERYAAREAEDWLEAVLATKSLSGPVNLSRFADPIYYLTDSFTWTPNLDNGPRFHAITVPKGFITDLASIPPPLFPLLRPDGDYAQAAIVHDFLYWFQTTERDYADEVFKIAMRDLEVNPVTIAMLHAGVRVGGEPAWKENKTLREGGEKRVLKIFPTKASTRWGDWKKKPEVFL